MLTSRDKSVNVKRETTAESQANVT